MHNEIYERVSKHPKFAELVSKRKRFAWTLSAVMLAVYYAFIMTIAFAPDLLGTPLSEGSITSVGIPVGIGIILIAIALTGIYVRRANAEFDELNNQIIEEAGL